MASEFRRRKLVIRIPAQDNPSSRIRGASSPSDFAAASGTIRPPSAPRREPRPPARRPSFRPDRGEGRLFVPNRARPAGPGGRARHGPGVMRMWGRPDRRRGASWAGPLRPPCPATPSPPCPAPHVEARAPPRRPLRRRISGGGLDGANAPRANPAAAIKPRVGGMRQTRGAPRMARAAAGGFPPPRPAGGRRQTKPQSAASSIRAGVSIPSTPVAGSRKTTCSTPAVRSPSASRCWRAAPGRHSASTAARTASLTRR